MTIRASTLTTGQIAAKFLFGLAITVHFACSFESIPSETTSLSAAIADAAQVAPATPRGALLPDELARGDLFDRVSPSVVYITTLTSEVNPFTGTIDQVPRGTGTGFIWDKQGHIVTNFHVLEGARSASVVLHDQISLPAQLVGVSPGHDLAVLQIDPGSVDLQPIVVGESANLRVGQGALAIGNPFGLSATLTTGIVSALGRRIPGAGQRTIEGVIQIDAAINPGNSGGPLLDSAGRLIGVTTAIASPSGVSAGIGFAVPVDTVRRVIPPLIQTGQYTPPQLGITADERLSNVILSRLGLQGVLILSVEPGSGADEAGLRGAVRAANGGLIPGDILQEIDNEKINSLGELQTVLDRYNSNDTVLVAILRQGQRISVEVRLS